MHILGIETSCDETAAAIVKDGIEVVSSSLATSTEFHLRTGGVVPEIAARKQVEYITSVIDDCIKKSNLKPSELNAIAVTSGPGLIGSLVVGVEAAKALALALNKPIIPVNHLVGHIYANFINKKAGDIKFPAVVLVVSGGHTDLVLMKNHGDLTHIGSTLDDAAGEAFDKVARLLGLAKYMGGPAVSKAAESWKPENSTIHFKRPMIDSKDFNFSFSGIKTAVLSKVKSFAELSGVVPVEEISYEFQEAVTDVLVFKTLEAVKKYGVETVMLAGGVSANKVLREKLTKECAKENLQLLIPPLELCTDNAIYIASCAHFNFNPKKFEEIKADPSLNIMSKV